MYALYSIIEGPKIINISLIF